MPLPLVVDTLDIVPEPFRAEYTEADGKFRLNVDGIEDTSGLKKALETERRTAKELSKKVQRWEALGKSDEEIQQMLESQRKADEDKARKAGEWDKIKAQMNEHHQKEL